MPRSRAAWTAQDRGPQMAATIKTITGPVQIDHISTSTSHGFEGVVDTLGGVDMCIPAENVNTPGYVAGPRPGSIQSTARSVISSIRDTGLDVVPGCQTLDGVAGARVTSARVICPATPRPRTSIGSAASNSSCRQSSTGCFSRPSSPSCPGSSDPILASLRPDKGLSVARPRLPRRADQGGSARARPSSARCRAPISSRTTDSDALKMSPSAQKIFSGVRAGKPLGNVGLTTGTRHLRRPTSPSRSSTTPRAATHRASGRALQQRIQHSPGARDAVRATARTSPAT